jgi:Mg2+ and Co2+ transporter CorA
VKSFLYSEATGFVEKDHWSANCLVKVETPAPDDIRCLINELQVSESFISDMEDTDVPTLIASFYGMNVINYPEEWPYGFLLITTASIGISILAFYIFKKIK